MSDDVVLGGWIPDDKKSTDVGKVVDLTPLSPASLVSRIEELSRTFHAIYQEEIRRQGQVVRHDDNYDNLSENTKELDRVLARYVLGLMEAQAHTITELEAGVRELEKMVKSYEMLFQDNQFPTILLLNEQLTARDATIAELEKELKEIREAHHG